MADWTASSNSFVRPYRSAHGGPFIRYYETSTAATASQIKTGDLVQFDTRNSGATDWRVARAQSTGGDAANLLGINGSNLLGVAMNPDESDGSTKGVGTGRKTGVALFDNQTEFIGLVRAGAVTSTLTGKVRSLIFDSTLKIWQVDSTNSTAALQTVVITEVPEAYAGDTGAPVVFKIYLSSLVHPSVSGSYKA